MADKPSDDRASFGFYPQLQRNRSKQDREAAKNVPVDLARGFVAGVAGAPGDIESLLRIPYDYLRAPTMSELVTGDKTSKTYIPTSEDIEKRLPFRSETPVSKAASGLGTLAGGFYYGPGSPLKVIGALPGAIRHGAEEFAKASYAGAPRVVKPKGGNWLGGGEKLGIPDNDLRRLKRTTTGGTDPANTLNEIRERFTPESIANLPEGAGKEHVLQSIAELEKDVALNKWIDSNLTNYVKKEMGTPNDPVRKLAEEGIIHTPLREDLDRMDYLKALRKAEGFPAKGMGKSDLAKQWEALSDDSIRVTKAGAIQDQINTGAELKKARAELDAYKKQIDKDFLARMSDHSGNKIFNPKETELLLNQPFVQKAEILGDKKYRQLQGNVNDLLARETGFEKRAGELNPFVAKLDPETRLYSGSTYDLGFDHIIDVLKQDVAAGRIRPEQLNKVSMEQAVRRTYEFDQEIAKQMREANFKITEGFPLHKEYPEGYKWIELAPPKELPAGYRVIQSDMGEGFKVLDAAGNEAVATASRPTNNMGHTNIPFHKTEQEAIADALKYDKRLEEALKYEGATMGHCVGGYCPDVVAGKSRIFSLRDAKGEPHVTIEVNPVDKHPIGYGMSGGKSFPDDFRYESGSIAPEQHQQIYQRAKQLFNPELASDLSSHRMDVFQQAANEIIGKPADQIIQIKGKQNLRPIEKYDPYTQDFVKSGNWSDIGDLKNTGLFTPQQIIGETTQKVLAQEGVKLPKLMTKAEADDYILQAYKTVAKQTNTNITPPEGMKAGGRVKISKNLDTMMLEVNNKRIKPVRKAAGGAINADDLILEERPL